VRLVADDDTLLRNAGELFHALESAMGAHQDGAGGAVWAAALRLATTASAYAALGAWAAVLACLKGLQDSGLNKKLLTQIIAIHKRKNHATFAAGYSLARAGILVRRLDSQQFTQSRHDFFLSKWMWFGDFEDEVAAARNRDELVAAWGNLHFALLVVYSDFCLCDLVGEVDRLACDLPSDVAKLKHAQGVLLHSKIAAREPVLVKSVLAWIDASIERLEYLSSAIYRIAAARTLEATTTSGSFRKAEAVFMAWVAKTHDRWSRFRGNRW
jgi:hypothetical protein